MPEVPCPLAASPAEVVIGLDTRLSPLCVYADRLGHRSYGVVFAENSSSGKRPVWNIIPVPWAIVFDPVSDAGCILGPKSGCFPQEAVDRFSVSVRIFYVE